MTLTRDQIELLKAGLPGCADFTPYTREELSALCDMALSSLPSGVTKTVPIKPTGVMLGLIAGEGTNDPPLLTRDQALIVYRAVLAAAPSPAPVAKIEEPMDEPRREDYALDSLYFDDLRRYIDSLRAALGEEIERLKRWYESTISVRELALTDRAERAESALREAREKERERCAKFLDGRISGSPGSLQATLVDAEVIQCAKAIRSMTDEK
jgi:hypothetical protein